MKSRAPLTRRQALGALAGACPALLRSASGDRPNVLWLMTDEQRPDSLACYGSRWAVSPNLDALAAEGIVFESAYTPSPVCVPARSSLLTGNFPSTTGVFHNRQRLPAGTRMLTWAFEAAGYQTASFGKKHYFLPGPRQAFQVEGGLAVDEVVGAETFPEHYDPVRHDVIQYPDLPARKLRRRWILAGVFPESRERTAEARNVNLAIRWLEQRDPRRPFFLRLSLNAPHTPYVAPAEFVSRIPADEIALPIPRSEDLAGKPARERIHLQDFEGALCLDAEQIRRIRRYYYARAAFADAEIGRLLEWMRRHDLLANTIVAFVSDHGTHLGEQGLLQKQTFYEQVATVPLILWWRGFPRRGVRQPEPVSTIGLLPTLCRLADIRLDWPFEGKAFLLPPAGQVPRDRPVFSEIKFGYQGYRDEDRQVMIRQGRWKLSCFTNGEPDGALYDLREDPGEKRNLYSSRPEVVNMLVRSIKQWDQRRSAGS